MNTTTNDDLLSLSAAAAICPAIDGKRPRSSTVWRWARKGIRGVRLECVMVGRNMATTRPALEKFFAECAKASCKPVQSPVPRAPRERGPAQAESAMAAADEKLRSMGVAV